MKKTYLTIMFLLFAGTALAADEFKPLTVDGTVNTVDDVQIQKIVPTTTTEVFTVGGIKAKIVDLRAQQLVLTAQIEEQKKLLALVTAAAGKVRIAVSGTK